jgi:hypothetical protein
MRRIVIRTGRRRRRNPLLAVVRWRYEIGLLALVAALVQLGRTTHWAVPWAIALGVCVALAAWPRARREVGIRVRSVVIQHRLRTAFQELALTSWAGRTPAIIWTSPCPEGLRVHVVCPAGVSADDMVAEREALAAACYAADVRVERDPRHATVVVLVVVTRVPPSGPPVPGAIPYGGT